MNKLFQFTPLREGRLCFSGMVSPLYYFNSRPSARGDGITVQAYSMIEFQFTPLREGRPEVVGGAIANQNISIHAPPRGATVRIA